LGGLGKIVQHDTEELVDRLYRATGDDIYICSFCGLHSHQNINANGLLSQWRGYGVGGGFALVFNSLKLEEMMQKESNNHRYKVTFMGDVVYSDDEKRLRDEYSDDISILAKFVEDRFGSQKLRDKKEGTGIDGLLPFMACVTRYTHHGFKEENEVRIVAIPMTPEEDKFLGNNSNIQDAKPEKERKFRLQGDEGIPYIELFRHIYDRLPIEKIIVGPHINREKRVATLRAMLRKYDIDVVCSDIPFIE
jgi:hypothetical protein